MFKRFSFVKISLVLTACFIASGCDERLKNKVSGVLSMPASRDTLVRGIYDSQWQLDPHFVTSEAQAAPLRDLLLGLSRFDQQGNLLPALAQEWNTEDGKIWQVKLDEQAKWSNGEPITAQDVVASWQRLASSADRTPLVRYLSHLGLQNAEAILQGQRPPSELAVRALDAHRLEIELVQPNFELPRMLTHAALLPTYQGMPFAVGQPFISSGAYQLSELSNKRLKLVTRVEQSAFKQVEYRLLTREDPLDWVDLVENPPVHFSKNLRYLPRLCLAFYDFNFADPLMSQKSVRQAIRAMISPIEISQGFGTPSYFAVPPSLFTVSNQALLLPSSEQFRLQATSPMNLTLSYDLQGEHPQIAERIARALGRSDLFRLKVEPLSWPALLAAREARTFQLIRSGWCADAPDPVQFLTIFHSKSPDNKSGYANHEVDIAIEKLQFERLEAVERERLILAVLQRLDDDVAFLPLFQYQRRVGFHPKIVGLSPNTASEVIYSQDLSYSKDKQ